MNQNIDLLILSNGPGELTTWVRPVVKALRKQFNHSEINFRISLILSPCPNATGKEVKIARSYSEIDRVQEAKYFWQFLLFGKTRENWDWYPKGLVLFLGGDQFFTVVTAKRLGYKSVIYAEWEARWWRYIDQFGVMKSDIVNHIPPQYQSKFKVIGDLMADVQLEPEMIDDQNKNQSPIIGLLPGSKAAKLSQGVPLTLAIAHYLHQKRPDIQFIIPVAPTLDLDTLARFANPELNPMIAKFGDISAQINLENTPFLETKEGVKIKLYIQAPAYEQLINCQLCLTTVGANTAELGSLAVPMIVLLPTQELDAMRSWDGIPGLLANLPGMGSIFAKLINQWVLKQRKLFAWPNIWAKAEIVPELVGELKPEKIGDLVLDYLEHPEKLEVMRDRLRQVRGASGAAEKLALIIKEELE